MDNRIGSCRALAGLLVFVALLLAAPGSAAAHWNGQPVHNLRLQSLLEAATREGLPGVSLRVSGPGVDFLGAAGVADLATGESLTPGHAIYAASLGKTFVVVVALQLCEAGQLDLDTPVTTWLSPQHAVRIPSSDTITLRHLLSHTSGLPGYMNDAEAWRKDFVRDPQRQWTHQAIIPYLYDRPLLFAPGTGYHYSNSNYILAGAIIEQVTGQPLHALIRERILAPLGLQDSFNGAEAAGGIQAAHGYFRRRGRIIDSYPWYSHYGLANAGMHSTPDDLARFSRILFTTERLLGESMRAAMTQASGLGRPPSDYGMGILVETGPGRMGRWYSNRGTDPGYQADMMYFPDIDLAIALAANASLGKATRVYKRLVKSVIRTARHAVFAQ
jgi:D-alanyl-D-alanine carboxypeptidase